MDVSYDELSKIRKLVRDQASEHRKCERSKVMFSKRPVSDINDLECQDITISQMKELAESIRRNGNIPNLKNLKRAFLMGEDVISAFLSVNGALVALVNLLLSKDAGIAVEACKCLANMSTYNHKATFAAIKAAAPYLITFLQGSTTMLQNYSARTLGNMAADCDLCRKRLEAQGLLPALVHLLSVVDKSALESCTFALTVYTKFEADSNKFLCEEGILKVLLPLIDDPEVPESTTFNVYSTVFHLTSSVNDVADYFIESGVVRKMVQTFIRLCSHSPYNVLLVTLLLRGIGNLCTGPDVVVEEICLENSFVDYSIQLLYSPYLHLRKEALWLLGNFATSHSSKLDDLSAILSHMDEVLSINMQHNIITEAVHFISVAQGRFEEHGLSGISPELSSRLQSINKLSSLK